MNAKLFHSMCVYHRQGGLGTHMCNIWTGSSLLMEVRELTEESGEDWRVSIAKRFTDVLNVLLTRPWGHYIAIYTNQIQRIKLYTILGFWQPWCDSENWDVHPHASLQKHDYLYKKQHTHYTLGVSLPSYQCCSTQDPFLMVLSGFWLSLVSEVVILGFCFKTSQEHSFNFRQLFWLWSPTNLEQ